MKKLMIVLILNLSFLFVSNLATARSATCLDGLEYCNEWCQDNYPGAMDFVARGFCYSGCAVAYVICEAGLHPDYK